VGALKTTYSGGVRESKARAYCWLVVSDLRLSKRDESLFSDKSDVT